MDAVATATEMASLASICVGGNVTADVAAARTTVSEMVKPKIKEYLMTFVVFVRVSVCVLFYTHTHTHTQI